MLRIADIENRLDTAAVALAVVETGSGLVTQVNAALAEVLGQARSELVGVDLGLLVRIEATELRRLLARLRDGELTSYQGRMELLRRTDWVPAQGWIRPLHPGPPFVTAVLGAVTSEDAPPSDTQPAPAGDLVLATLDHEWRFDGLATGLQAALAWPMGESDRARLIDLVHPGDAAAVTATLGRSGLEQRPHVIAARLAAQGGVWDGAVITASPICAHPTPRMALAIQFGPTTTDRMARLEGHLLRIGAEVRSAGLWADEAPSSFRGLPALTDRQNQIVIRLAAGVSVGAIATELFISPSTVRNHLSAVYRRLEISTQSQLLEIVGRKPRRRD